MFITLLQNLLTWVNEKHFFNNETEISAFKIFLHAKNVFLFHVQIFYNLMDPLEPVEYKYCTNVGSTITSHVWD